MADLPHLDESFHDVYDRTRQESKHRAPVIVVLGDTLFVYGDDARREIAITSAPAQVLKEAAHVPVGLFLVARRLGTDAIDEAGADELRRLRRLCTDRGDSPGLDEPMANDVSAVLDRCVHLLDAILAKQRVDRERLHAFAAEIGPRLLGLAEKATRLQLATLHDAAEKVLAGFSSEDRDALRIVVAGAHQARVRSLPMQYFQKLLDEKPGVEERVLYAEAVSEPDKARELVGTNLLDREIAGAFFGDPRRLQRDVLGDITTAILGTASPPA